MNEKIKLLREAAENGVLFDFIPPGSDGERDLMPIIIAVLAWCDGDKNALRSWPNIARFFAIRSTPPINVAPGQTLTAEQLEKFGS